MVLFLFLLFPCLYAQDAIPALSLIHISLTTILGMVPMAIGGGEGSEMWQPLGVSVIGGYSQTTDYGHP